MKIDYLGHSGFLVETDSVQLLFDYYRGDLSLLDQKPAEKPLYVFVSHAHGDHFNPKVFSLAKGTRPVKFILSFDLKGNNAIKKRADILYAEADATYAVDGLGTVQTLLSTDEGVAYLVTTQTETIFHAGDLNWWDWPGEDPEWLAEQETVFQREIGKLAGKRIDAAFVVLDDRLEENYAKGMSWFLSVCHPSYVLPMHFWEDQSVIDRFKALPAAADTGTTILDTAKETSWSIGAVSSQLPNTRADPKMTKERNNLIFVYGTLMRGERANSFLRDAQFAGDAVLKGYAMYDLGSYPGIAARDGEAVLGELYFVDAGTLQRLDEYEGEGSLYKRITVRVATSDGETAEALAYLYAHPVHEEKLLRVRWNMKADAPVWYAAYGSNLCADRFRCYIEGGVCEMNGVEYRGCRDKTLWTQTEVKKVPGRMYYAGRSPSWENRGVAFFTPEREGETVMRFYKITYGQLRDIQEQEGNSANWYGRMLFIDFIHGVPAFTITSEHEQVQSAPCERYCSVIFDGLTRDCGIRRETAREYLELCRAPLGIWEKGKTE